MKSPKTPYPLNIQNMKSSFILHVPLFIGVPEWTNEGTFSFCPFICIVLKKVDRLIKGLSKHHSNAIHLINKVVIPWHLHCLFSEWSNAFLPFFVFIFIFYSCRNHVLPMLNMFFTIVELRFNLCKTLVSKRRDEKM